VRTGLCISSVILVVVQRRAYFRTDIGNNGELPLAQQYLARLQAADVAPLYAANGHAEEETTMDDTRPQADRGALTAASIASPSASAAAAASPTASPLSLESLRAALSRTLQLSPCRTPAD